MLEIYNDVTRAVGREQRALVIDLARALPKDSAYFYDWTHFTNEGAERVAEILNQALVPWLIALVWAYTTPGLLMGAAPPAAETGAPAEDESAAQ